MDILSRDYGKMNYIDNRLESVKFVAIVLLSVVVSSSDCLPFSLLHHSFYFFDFLFDVCLIF